MSRWLVILLIILFPVISNAQKIENGQRFRALVIGIDGMKGPQFYQRVFDDNKASNLKSIADQGQFAVCTSILDSHCARTHSGPRLGLGYSWVTSSGWAAVLTGVNTDKHLVKDNEYESQAVFAQTTKSYPTFFSQLKQRGFITAAAGVGNYISATGSDGLGVSPGIIDYECGLNPESKRSSVDATAASSCNIDYRQSFHGDDENRDINLTNWLVKMVDTDGDNSPDMIMGVYDTVDDAGHRFNYSSNPGYLNAITTADSEIGNVIDVIKKRVAEKNEVWLVIVTSDHGGHGDLHGGGAHNYIFFHDEVVPLVVGVFGNHVKLNNRGPISARNAKQMDVSPSVLHWFGVSQTVTDGTVRSDYMTD